ncbi:MAG: MFS transporter [Stellaceae bacterium]
MTCHLRRDTACKPPLYHGWLIVAGAFLVAAFGFGLGFYGPGIYLLALEARHGWSAAELSLPITAYYVLGAALLFFRVGAWFERCGARAVVTMGAVAMACGLALLSAVGRLWHVYAAFAVMSLGWATMSGAAIALIVAPWFERRRGLAVGWGLNGGSAGGIVFAPLLTVLIARLGFAIALDVAAAAMLAILVPVAGLVLRRKRVGEADPADGANVDRPPSAAAPSDWRRLTVLRSPAFLTISVPFALGMIAQVGFLTHQMAFLAPRIGAEAAGWGISLTTAAAVLGRIATGCIVDRVDRRAVACINFLAQALAMAILAIAAPQWALYLGCALFGLGVGNVTLLPALIVQQEFPEHYFSRVVSLVVAINQFSFAFGPSLLGQLQRAAGGYALALAACLVMQVTAALVVAWPRPRMAAG